MGIGLKTVPKVVPPNLLKLLGEMRNGEQVVFADRGFPSATLCSRIGGPTEIRVDGNSVAQLLRASLRYFPIDRQSSDAVVLMRCPKRFTEEHESQVRQYKEIINEAENSDLQIMEEEPLKFYERAAKAYVVHTNDKNDLGSIILKKGILHNQ